jgi:outer membrane receptor protein involved in Fe transport
MLINDPRANQDYKSLELAVSKRFTNGFQFQGSYSATKKNIPLINTSGGGLTVGVNTYDPNAEINTSDKTWEWLGRLSGAYRVKWDVLVSANYERRSGTATARTVSFTGGKQIPSISLRVEPIGSIRMPDINLLDLRAEKTIRLTSSQRVAVRLNIFNAANVSTVTSETVLSGPNFGRATAIVPPRTFELSASYTF